MRRFALWVEFEIVPGGVPGFLAAARDDAAGSTANEPGCRRFDVLVDPARPSRVCFYEIYDDEAAFETHKATAHFRAFAEATKTSIVGRNVTRLLVEDDSRAAPDMLPA